MQEIAMSDGNRGKRVNVALICSKRRQGGYNVASKPAIGIVLGGRGVVFVFSVEWHERNINCRVSKAINGVEVALGFDPASLLHNLLGSTQRVRIQADDVSPTFDHRHR